MHYHSENHCIFVSLCLVSIYSLLPQVTGCPVSCTILNGESLITNLRPRLFPFQCCMVCSLLSCCDIMLIFFFFLLCLERYQAKFAAIQGKLGREIRVFETSALSPSSNEVSNSGMKHFNFCIFLPYSIICAKSYKLPVRPVMFQKIHKTSFLHTVMIISLFFFFWMFIIEETDDFYEFTAEDYYRILAAKKQGNMNDDPILLVVMLNDKALLTLHHF